VRGEGSRSSLAHASGYRGVAALRRLIERKQNVESAGEEKGILEAAIAECEEKLNE
jgi:hypothetical protein